jgi:hypothetical protein
MRRIAARMVGGMITAPLLSMFVIPAAYLLIRRPRARGESDKIKFSADRVNGALTVTQVQVVP